MHGLRKRLTPFISTESIDFQSDAFFKELVLIVNEIRELKNDKMADSDQVGSLGRVIQHHTGLNVAVDLGGTEPAMQIPMLDKNHPLVNSFIRNHLSSAIGQKMIADAKGAIRGTVNLNTGKVSGIFSEIQSIMFMPLKMFQNKKYTSEEIAGFMLHECGHLLTYYEFINRSVTTNQVLAGMSKALDGSGTPHEREAVMMSVKQALKLPDLDVAELSKAGTKVSEIVVISNVLRQTESELGSCVYDFSSWEYLCDQYAARQGGGRHVVTGLDKLMREQGNISFRSTAGYLAMEALKFFMLLVNPGVSIMLIAMDSAGDGSYDRPGARFKRIRNQLVEALKDQNLSKDDVSRFKADIEAVDDILAKVDDRRQLIGVLWDFVSPNARRNNSQKKLQQDLEALAANDLFIKAANLKQLA